MYLIQFVSSFVFWLRDFRDEGQGGGQKAIVNFPSDAW